MWSNMQLQVYGPCVLLVVISWVSFWLNREATSDRISLGISSHKKSHCYFLILRHHNRANDDIYGSWGSKGSAKSNLPNSPWLFCLHFLHVHLLNRCAGDLEKNEQSLSWISNQFGLVHHFTKLGSGEYYLEELEDEVCPKSERDKREKERIKKKRKASLTTFRSLNTVNCYCRQ